MKNKILMLLVLVLMASCKKNGTGGKATIEGSVEHHGLMIPNSMVYIKYKTTEFPGADVSVYDAKTQADATGHYKIENMRMGTYYLYGAGYDSSIYLPVSGGVPLVIKFSERKNTIDFDIPVTE